MGRLCYWWEQREGKETLVFHIIERIEPTETPAGTEAEEYFAVCGESQFSYGVGFMPPTRGTREEARQSGAVLCQGCKEKSVVWQTAEAAVERKALSMNSMTSFVALDNLDCPRCGEETIACCYGWGPSHDYFCHVCLNAHCDWSNYGEVQFNIGSDFIGIADQRCIFCSRIVLGNSNLSSWRRRKQPKGGLA